MLLCGGGYLTLAAPEGPGYWRNTGHVAQQMAHGVAAAVGSGAVAPPERRLCAPGGAGEAVSAALALSARNSLLFAAGILGDKSRQVQACLYGTQTVAGRPEPRIPGWVSALGAVQMVLSAVLLFLFGLALRNQFKIR